MFSRRSITVVKLMENKRRLTRGSSTNHDWEKPSGCRPWDEYSKHSSPQLFRFFSRFPPSIRQETPLLVYLDPLDCIDPRIFKVSWFLAFIFIVLCSTFQYGCSDMRFWFFWVIQFEMGLFRLIVSRLVYFSQNFEEKILIFHSPPRPRYRFRGTLQNHDDDSNGNVKKQYVFKMSKTTILHVHPAFLYISLPSLHNYDVK